MNCVIIFVLIIVIVKHESLGQDGGDEPACPKRTALPFVKDLMGKLSQNWFVNRVTIMKQLPASAKDPPTMNCCSPLTYLEDCKGQNPAGGIHVFREWMPGGGHIKVTKAYSNNFKNIAEFWEAESIYDTAQAPKLIYGGTLTQMYLHSSETEVQQIKSFDFPPLILFAVARVYAIVYYQPNLEWIHYMDCDYAVSWVEMSEAVVSENRVDAINKEIDQYLAKNPSTPAMELIPAKLPFKV